MTFHLQKLNGQGSTDTPLPWKGDQLDPAALISWTTHLEMVAFKAARPRQGPSGRMDMIEQKERVHRHSALYSKVIQHIKKVVTEFHKCALNLEANKKKKKNYRCNMFPKINLLAIFFFFTNAKQSFWA